MLDALLNDTIRSLGLINTELLRIGASACLGIPEIGEGVQMIARYRDCACMELACLVEAAGHFQAGSIDFSLERKLTELWELMTKAALPTRGPIPKAIAMKASDRGAQIPLVSDLHRLSFSRDKDSLHLVDITVRVTKLVRSHVHGLVREHLTVERLLAAEPARTATAHAYVGMLCFPDGDFAEQLLLLNQFFENLRLPCFYKYGRLERTHGSESAQPLASFVQELGSSQLLLFWLAAVARDMGIYQPTRPIQESAARLWSVLKKIYLGETPAYRFILDDNSGRPLKFPPAPWQNEHPLATAAKEHAKFVDDIRWVTGLFEEQQLPRLKSTLAALDALLETSSTVR